MLALPDVVTVMDQDARVGNAEGARGIVRADRLQLPLPMFDPGQRGERGQRCDRQPAAQRQADCAKRSAPPIPVS